MNSVDTNGQGKIWAWHPLHVIDDLASSHQLPLRKTTKAYNRPTPASEGETVGAMSRGHSLRPRANVMSRTHLQKPSDKSFSPIAGAVDFLLLAMGYTFSNNILNVPCWHFSFLPIATIAQSVTAMESLQL